MSISISLYIFFSWLGFLLIRALYLRFLNWLEKCMERGLHRTEFLKYDHKSSHLYTCRADLSPLVFTQVAPSCSWINLSTSSLPLSFTPRISSKNWETSSFPTIALWPELDLSCRKTPASVKSSTKSVVFDCSSTWIRTGCEQAFSGPGRWKANHKQIDVLGT